MAFTELLFVQKLYVQYMRVISVNPQRIYFRIQVGGEGKTGGYDFVNVVYGSQSHTSLL